MRLSRCLLPLLVVAAGLISARQGMPADGEVLTCPVDGSALTVTAKTKSVRVNDQRIYFCSPACLTKFAASPGKFVTVPIKCPVYSDRPTKVADMRRIVNNGVYYLCCMFCWDDFGRDPGHYLKELDDPVTGKPFAPTKESPVVQIDGQVYLFQADSTREAFEKDPKRYVIRYR